MAGQRGELSSAGMAYACFQPRGAVMSNAYKVAIVVGSLREGSFNKKAARAFQSVSPPELTFETLEIGDLPLYNEDLDKAGQVPASWARLRAALDGVDGVVFFTPEYNRGIPGLLKNAIDVGSRPYGQNKWGGKPGAVISVSPGGIGGFGANHQLRQSMVFLDVAMLQQPEAYVGNGAKLFDDAGGFVNDDTKKFFTTMATAYAAWLTKLRRVG
jgi:chromate reductase